MLIWVELVAGRAGGAVVEVAAGAIDAEFAGAVEDLLAGAVLQHKAAGTAQAVQIIAGLAVREGRTVWQTLSDGANLLVEEAGLAGRAVALVVANEAAVRAGWLARSALRVKTGKLPRRSSRRDKSVCRAADLRL